jgi:hypothetical protein
MQWLNATVSGVGLIPLDPFFAIGDIHVSYVCHIDISGTKLNLL